MCYSNSSTATAKQLAARFGKKINPKIDVPTLFCVSGFTHPIWPIITNEAEIQFFQWGLIPNWANAENALEIQNRTLNARSETVYEKPSFNKLIGRNHCLVPSTGFFEWQHIGKEKRPFFIHKGLETFAMAGIYDSWLNPLTGKIVNSFSILTTEASPLMAEIHNVKKRMPVILSKENEASWLVAKSESEVISLMKPYLNSDLTAYRINSSYFGTEKQNSSLIFAEYVDAQGSLF